MRLDVGARYDDVMMSDGVVLMMLNEDEFVFCEFFVGGVIVIELGYDSDVDVFADVSVFVFEVRREEELMILVMLL